MTDVRDEAEAAVPPPGSRAPATALLMGGAAPMGALVPEAVVMGAMMGAAPMGPGPMGGYSAQHDAQHGAQHVGYGPMGGYSAQPNYLPIPGSYVDVAMATCAGMGGGMVGGIMGGGMGSGAMYMQPGVALQPFHPDGYSTLLASAYLPSAMVHEMLPSPETMGEELHRRLEDMGVSTQMDGEGPSEAGYLVGMMLDRLVAMGMMHDPEACATYKRLLDDPAQLRWTIKECRELRSEKAAREAADEANATESSGHQRPSAASSCQQRPSDTIEATLSDAPSAAAAPAVPAPAPPTATATSATPASTSVNVHSATPASTPAPAPAHAGSAKAPRLSAVAKTFVPKAPALSAAATSAAQEGAGAAKPMHSLGPFTAKPAATAAANAPPGKGGVAGAEQPVVREQERVNATLQTAPHRSASI